MYAKLLTITGKMQVAQTVRTNIFGQWQLTSYMVQIQAVLAAARNLLLNLALQKQAPKEKHLRNNFLVIFTKKYLLFRQVFFISEVKNNFIFSDIVFLK